MDIETAEAIDSLRADIRRVDQSVIELRAEVASLRPELRGEMADMAAGLRTELRDGLAGNRRHTEVLFEQLHADIQLLAEGFAHLSVKLDAGADDARSSATTPRPGDRRGEDSRHPGRPRLGPSLHRRLAGRERADR